MPIAALARPETVVNGKLRLFSLSVDFAASARAKWAAGAITKLAGPHWEFSAEMWKLDSLNASESIRKLITSDAARADVLIVAASSLDRREPKLIEWLDSLAPETNRSIPGLLVGLFGDEEDRSGELEWMAEQFIYCARQMGRGLVLHWMESDSLNDSNWLAEEMEEFLARKRVVCSRALPQATTVDVAGTGNPAGT